MRSCQRLSRRGQVLRRGGGGRSQADGDQKGLPVPPVRPHRRRGEENDDQEDLVYLPERGQQDGGQHGLGEGEGVTLGVECLQEGSGVLRHLGQGLPGDDGDHHGHQGGRILLQRMGKRRDGEVHSAHNDSPCPTGRDPDREGDALHHGPQQSS